MNTYFLILTIFFPRLTLLVSYMSGLIPANIVPFWGDVVMGVFVPRVLVLIYIYHSLGIHSGWFWLHVVALILTYGGGSTVTTRKSSRSQA